MSPYLYGNRMSLVDKKTVAILLIVLVSLSGLIQAAACVCTCCKDEPARSEEASPSLFLSAGGCQCSITCGQGQDSPLAERRVVAPDRRDPTPPAAAQSLASLPTPAPFAIFCDSVSYSAHFNACIQARLCRLLC